MINKAGLKGFTLVEVLATTALLGLLLVVVSDFSRALLNTSKFSAEKDKVREKVRNSFKLIREDLLYATQVLEPGPGSSDEILTLQMLSEEFTRVDSQRFELPPVPSGFDEVARWPALDDSHLEYRSYEFDRGSLVREFSGEQETLLTATDFAVERIGKHFFKISIEVQRPSKTETFQLRVQKL